MRSANPPLSVSSFPGGMWIGSHCSGASPRCERSRAALRHSASPVQSRSLFQWSSASLTCRAATRERAAALDCFEPSRKDPKCLLAAVAGSRAPPVRFVRLSLIPDCHSLLRSARPPQTISAAFQIERIVPILPYPCGRKGHSGSLVLCGQSTGLLH